jgi:hypothetical protein
MLAIIKILGNPTEADKAFISDKQALKYIDSFPKTEPIDFH